MALIALAIGCLLYMLYKGLQQINQNLTQPQEIVLEQTPISLEDIRPRGELYVCTSVLEDYVREQHTEHHLGLIPEQHSCVQILRQKVSYRINLKDIVYTPDTLNIVFVRMPDVIYTASTQDSPFLSDDEAYWNKQLPNTNSLKRRVEKKIRQRFDTPANRQKAEQYACEAVAQLLRQMGYEPLFEPTVIEQKKD